MSKLDGKIAVITGGNSGIGLATAREFDRQGAKIALFGRTEKTLKEAKDSIENESLSVLGDVRNLADLDNLFEQVATRFGKIDILVANAGWGAVMPFEEIDEETFDAQFEINVKGAFFTIQKALPLMKDGGTVVILSSMAGFKGFPGMSAYGATKAAVRSLARTLTAELAPRGIRVNALSPGAIDTPAFGRLPGLPREALDQFASAVPLGRPGTSEEMAKAILFLASEDSAYIAGAELVADGGVALV